MLYVSVCTVRTQYVTVEVKWGALNSSRLNVVMSYTSLVTQGNDLWGEVVAHTHVFTFSLPYHHLQRHHS